MYRYRTLRQRQNDRLAWARPQLVNPTTITPTNGAIGTDSYHLMDDNTDYIVNLGTAAKNRKVSLEGGRNIWIIGGEISIQDQGVTPPSHSRRNAFLAKGWTGTLHIEGVVLSGDLSEGFQLDYDVVPNSICQIQNSRVEQLSSRDRAAPSGGYTDNHDDLWQIAGGTPTSQLRIDKLTGYTDYQGCLIGPLDEDGTGMGSIDVRRWDVHEGPSPYGRYIVYLKHGGYPITFTDCLFEAVGSGQYLDAASTVYNADVSNSYDFTSQGIRDWTENDQVYAPRTRVGIGYTGGGYSA